MCDQIELVVSPSSWASFSLSSKFTKTSPGKGNAEQLHPSPSFIFFPSNKGATGRLSVAGKCAGSSDVAPSEHSRLTTKSQMRSICFSSLSSGCNYNIDPATRRYNQLHRLSTSTSSLYSKIYKIYRSRTRESTTFWPCDDLNRRKQESTQRQTLQERNQTESIRTHLKDYTWLHIDNNRRLPAIQSFQHFSAARHDAHSSFGGWLTKTKMRLPSTDGKER